MADGLTKSSAGCLLEKRSDIWNRSAPREEYECLEQETTLPKEVRDVSVVQMDLEQKDWWQSRHNTGITEYLLTTCSPTTSHGTTKIRFTVNLSLLCWFPVTRTLKLASWCTFVDSFVTSTHCVAQVPE